MTNTLSFKVPEFKQLTPEQVEENKKRLEEMIEQEYPEIAKQMICSKQL